MSNVNIKYQTKLEGMVYVLGNPMFDMHLALNIAGDSSFKN